MGIFVLMRPIRRLHDGFELRRTALRPPRHRNLSSLSLCGKQRLAMEELMLEILISLRQTGAEIYGFALGLIGIGIGTIAGLVIVVAKEEVNRK